MRQPGVVDRFHDGVLSGWIRCDGLETPKVVARLEGWIGHGEIAGPRPDLKDPACRGFTITLPQTATLAILAEIEVTLVTGADQHKLGLWRPLTIAAVLSATPAATIGQALRLLEPEGQGAVSEALRTLITPWLVGDSRPRTLAIVTHAHSNDAWFEYYYNYYTSIVDPSDIHIITTNPKLFNKYGCTTVRMHENLFDNQKKSSFVSNYTNALLGTAYRYACVADVDEIIMPDPRSGASFMEALCGLSEVSLVRGYDVLETDDDAPFDDGAPVLAQRRIAIPNMGVSKTFLTMRQTNWSGGFHYCNHYPRYLSDGTGFICLHLKWACQRRRAEVARMVQGVQYAQQTTASYALNSVSTLRHPLIGTENTQTEDRAGPLETAFRSAHERSIRYNRTRDMWIGKLDSADFLVRFA